MTPTTIALVKIVIASVLLFVVCKVEGYLESKLTETSGTRTDILILSSVIISAAIGIFICYQIWIVISPVLEPIIFTTS